MDKHHCGRHVKRKRQQQMYETERKNVKITIQQHPKPVHPVHVLTKHEFEKIKDNNIVLEDLKSTIIKSGKRTNRQIIYNVNRDNVGKNLKLHFKPNTHNNIIHMNRIKKRFITVTTRVCASIVNDDRIELIGNVPENASGMILLMIATFNDKIKNDLCVDDIVEIFRKCKKPIKVGNNSDYHFGTSGETYGVGLVAKYNIDRNGCSFGPYARRDSHFSSNHIAESNKIMEYLLNLSLKLPTVIIPNIYKNTSIVGSAVKDQLCKSNHLESQITNLDSTPTYISSQFNINVTTKYPHTEFDQSSTVIFVPNQTTYSKDYFFEFRFNHFTSIHINLQRGTSLLYSAYLLVHRQISSDMIFSEMNPSLNTSDNKNINQTSKKNKNRTWSSLGKIFFINISSYFNERLFNNIRQSHIRLSKNQTDTTNSM